MSNLKAGSVDTRGTWDHPAGPTAHDGGETAVFPPGASPFDSADLAAYVADHLRELQELARACGRDDIALPLEEARRAALDALAGS